MCPILKFTANSITFGTYYFIELSALSKMTKLNFTNKNNSELYCLWPFFNTLLHQTSSTIKYKTCVEGLPLLCCVAKIHLT